MQYIQKMTSYVRLYYQSKSTFKIQLIHMQHFLHSKFNLYFNCISCFSKPTVNVNWSRLSKSYSE